MQREDFLSIWISLKTYQLRGIPTTLETKINHKINIHTNIFQKNHKKEFGPRLTEKRNSIGPQRVNRMSRQCRAERKRVQIRRKHAFHRMPAPHLMTSCSIGSTTTFPFSCPRKIRSGLSGVYMNRFLVPVAQSPIEGFMTHPAKGG